jgi:2-oxoglutarate dehydrogenase E2 component (dihydrolipoamide succinyltransferase)
MSIIEMRVPTIGESIAEVTLSQWLKEDGAFVEMDESICEFESDKATLEFPAEAAGKLTWVAAEEDDLAIGALVATIDTSVTNGAAKKEETKIATPAPATTAVPEAPAPAKESYATGHPSPAAAKEDVLVAIAAKKSVPTPEAPKPAAKKEAPVVASVSIAAFSRGERTKKMSRMRRTIAKRLVSAKNNTAMLTTFNEVDLTEIMALRKKYQEQFVEKYGVKLGFMSLFTKACTKVLMEMPEVNAYIDAENNQFIYHDFVDVSIAISTPNGLVVPPIRNAESLKFHEIELEIKRLAGKARKGELTLDEMKGGTFTITNGGVFGSMMSTPILNEPQSAILGMHTIQQRPMAVNGEVKIRPMMYLALSYDHRIIDGSTSVTFLVRVKKLLEDPTSLLLDL